METVLDLDNIPMGTRLEVWKYKFSDGNLNLYFVTEGENLDYIAFALNCFSLSPASTFAD